MVLVGDLTRRKIILFSFLIFLLLPVFSGAAEKADKYFKLKREGDRVIWEMSASLINREWMLVNRYAAVGERTPIQVGSMCGDPQIVQLKEKADGRVALIYKAIMSKNAGSNMLDKPKAPYEMASFPLEKSDDGKRMRMDITSWVVRDSGMVEGKLRPETLRVLSHPDGMEFVGWRERRGQYAQVSSCLFLMSDQLMRLRYEDKRVGYFRSRHLVCGDTMAMEDSTYCITRWRLEPRPEEMRKYRRGILVEPREPIVFYIDPLTPAKWVPYIKRAINNWSPVFERAGFKNAIRAEEAPRGDSTWTLESCRAAIVYQPTTEENAFGERYADPRSGQIYHARIMWGHSLVEWLKGNYILQAGVSDPVVFSEGVSDDWLGRLLAVIVSHEVGHTLGLTHNFGASSVVPVEKLRNNAWLTEHGISASIMDYSRFNYVAQPGDNIDRENLIPRINVYDEWAIEWGYRLFPRMKTLEQEHAYILKWTGGQQKNWGYWFGAEMGLNDPRAQSEDLGDDLVIANTYGMENLKRVLAEMETWQPDEDGSYTTYRKMYDRIITFVDRKVPVGQYYHYIKHVVNIVGGDVTGFDDRGGATSALVDSVYQSRAMEFLGEHLFNTPEWLLKPLLEGKVERNPLEFMETLHVGTLAYLLPKASNLPKDSAGVYTLNDFFEGLTRVVWGEDVLKGKVPDVFRQNLQRVFFKEIDNYGRRGGPRSIEVYKGYVADLKKRLEQVLVNNQDETFGVYCQDMFRLMNKFLK